METFGAACYRHPTFKRRRKTSPCFAMVVLVLAAASIGVSSAKIPYYNEAQEHSKNRQRRDQRNKEPNNNVAEQMLFSFFEKLNYLEGQYGSNLVTVQDATDVYPILSQSDSGCPVNTDKFQENKANLPCYTPIVTIHDRISNPVDQSQYLPEVLLLSGIDTPKQMDILGPSSIYETLKLLLDCAACEALSPWVVPPAPAASKTSSPLNDTTTLETGLSFNPAVKCRTDLQSQGIDDSLRKWMARLAATRKIIALPIVDVAGFYQRLEIEYTGYQQSTVDGGADSAKIEASSSSSFSQCDFPYPDHWKNPSSLSSSESSSNECMIAFPSQLVNELFRSHAIQLGLAFHGHVDDFLLPSGWVGVPSWESEVSLSASESSTIASVDEDAMIEIGWAYSMFGGGFTNSGVSPYSVQAIPPKSQQVIAEQTDSDCKGATLEHWAFSAGLTLNNEPNSGVGPIWLEQCDGEYASKQPSHYDSLSLRSFIASVVASTSNEYPPCLPGFEVDETLCLPETNDPHFFFDDSSHLGSNLRMSLLATELVEPWTSIRSIAGVELRDDIVPLSPRLPENCPEARAMTLPESVLMKDVNITWTVGGAVTVTETAIMHGKWDVLDKKIFNCLTQPTKQELDSFFTILRDFEVMEGETAQEMEDDVSFTPVQNGVTRWHPSQLTPIGSFLPAETSFSVTLDLSDYKAGDIIAIYALARTDQREYTRENQPQSSFVNTRTNPDWSHTNTGTTVGSASAVQGRLDWFSLPVTITIGQQPGFFQSKQPVETSVRVSDIGLVTDGNIGIEDLLYSVLAAIVVVSVVFCCSFCREESDGTDVFSVLKERRAIKRQKISMDDFFSEEVHSLELT